MMDRLRRRLGMRGRTRAQGPSCRVYNPQRDPFWRELDRQQRESKAATERTIRTARGPLDDILFPDPVTKRRHDRP